jgi:transcriptional regulator with XRE-family HTH domain
METPTVPTDDSFAIRLLRAQSAKRVNKHQLMELTALSEYAIRSFQTNAANPTMHSLVALAKALGVSTDYLCGLKEN